MSEYKLSASLKEHEDDVRGVVFPHPKFILSASRDATVRLWKLLSPEPPKYDCSIVSHASAFVNAVAYHPPTSAYPEGLIISGGKDTIIEVRQPGRPPDDNAEALLAGHAHNVCALDVSSEGGFVVSGSWDSSARVWRIGKWECDAILEGHEASVWAVLAYDRDTIITGCADKLIRVFTSSGKLLRKIKGSTEVVRTLCRLPKGHPSGADFASACNGGIIRLWILDGRQVGELHGHESFIYSLASLPSGEIVSSGEDRTVRIWKGDQCVQTITHPAISVWCVATCAENGDIVSGASDRMLRVFSKDKSRYGDPQIIAEFEESVRSSSIPQQQVGEVNKEKLPGPEFLQQKSGTKEGQVVMIQESNGIVTAHQWSQGAQQWLSAGTVVDAVGSSGKKQHYQGHDYDYVFDVDIEDGKPPLKLPYDLSQNPYGAATKFIQDNELPITYLDTVANFITTNTQGATLGQTSQAQSAPNGTDPWGSEARYRPGETSTTPSQPPASIPRPKVIPQRSYLSIKTANLRVIQKKIGELNTQLVQEGSKDISLNPQQLETLQSYLQALDSNSTQLTQTTMTEEGLELILKIATVWPPAQRLPGLDVLRILVAISPVAAEFRTSDGSTIIDILAQSGVFEDKDRANNIMLAIRTFSNLFDTETGRELTSNYFAQIHKLVKTSATDMTNRNLIIAVTTLYVNYAVLFTSSSHLGLPSSVDQALELLSDLVGIVSSATDSEAVYRGLVAVGTLMSLGEEIPMAAKEVYDLNGALVKVEKRLKEPRIRSVVGEIRGLMER